MPTATPARPLTARQRQVLAFVRRFARNRRRVPTVREVAAGIGVTCRKTAEEHLDALARKGYADVAAAVRPSLAAVASGMAATSPPPSPCRHCGRPRPTRQYGLCWGCRRDPAVRGRYATPRAEGLFVGVYSRPLPPEPTAVPPGSGCKLAVMAWRARHGFAIFHPGDAGTPRRGFADFARRDEVA